MLAPRMQASLSPEEKAGRLGWLLEMWLEIGRSCDFLCEYCCNAKMMNRGPLMSEAQYIATIRQFATLGGRSLGIPGFGEPLHPANYPTTLVILAMAKNLGISTTVFTAGDHLDDRVTATLYDLGASVMLKVNSFHPEVQDRLVGVAGYTARREKAIQTLISTGFNAPEVDEYGHPTTRLGFVTMMRPENLEELPSIWRWCRENNIHPDVDTELGHGAGHDNLVSDQQKRLMFEMLQRLDRDEFGIEWRISPTYVGGCCSRFNHHLYVRYDGKVCPCLGANLRDVVVGDSSDLVAAGNSPLMCKIRSRDYAGRCTECRLFQEGACNSCFGRYMDRMTMEETHTTGCWCFTPSPS